MNDFLEIWLSLLGFAAALGVLITAVWAASLVAFWLAVIVAVLFGSLVFAALIDLASRP